MRRLLILLLLPLLLAGVPTGAVATTAEGEEVDGGPAATRATPVEPGTGYVDDVQAGEARWYAVEVAAGQALDLTLTEYGEVEYGCCLELRLHDRDFDQIVFDNLSNSDGTATTSRVSSSEDGVGESGTYYAEIRLTGDPVRPVTYEFVLDVTGEPVGGAAEESAAPAESQSESPVAEESDTTADDTEPAAAEAGSGSGGSVLLWLILALLVVLVVLLLVAVAFLLIRMQRLQSGRGGGSAH